MIINLKKAFAIYVSYYTRSETKKPFCAIPHRVAKRDTCFLQKLENTTFKIISLFYKIWIAKAGSRFFST